MLRGLVGPGVSSGVLVRRPDPAAGCGRGGNRLAAGWWWPWAVVAATVGWSLWETRAMLLPVAYADDSAVHEQMVRFAAARIAAGRDPLTSWFPFLGLGSPQFLHYQGTPAILTGLAGLVAGPDAAFRWSGYLLWCLWPVAVYGSARVFGLDRPAAGLAGVTAPLLHSVEGIGYEQHAYAWAGFGVWTQLWGSWALPFAWALCWRAMTDRRFLAPAAGLVAVTTAFHFETGYLAFAAIVVMPFLVRAGLGARLGRAVVLLAASLLAAAWVVVPLLAFSRWAGINQALAGGPSANGYGARVTLRWALTGGLLDAGHLPVISLLAAAGLAAAAARWRQAGPERALIALLCGCLVLSFGRTTFGGLISIVPGHADVFFRRFAMGGQLAAIYLAGIGAAEAISRGGRMAAAGAGLLARRGMGWASWAPPAAAGLAAVAWLAPAWGYLDAYDQANAAGIHAQLAAQRRDAAQINALAAVLRARGAGRAYAGSPAGWGQFFTVGQVPAFKYLESLDADEVGNTLRTASLMTQPEFRFDEASPGDYPLFGIRYLIYPSRSAPAVPPGAVPLLASSMFRVWELPASSYFRIGQTTGTLTANRADIGTQAIAYLRSALPGLARYLTVSYAGHPPAPPSQPAPPARPSRAARPAGTILSSDVDLAGGQAGAVVRLRRPTVLVLSASFDPGWTVTIDGRPAAVQMVSPALPAVAVPPGTHHITFRYTGFRGYPALLALAGLDLLAVALASRRGPRSITRITGRQEIAENYDNGTR